MNKRALVACKHGHLHRGQEAAHVCEVAHQLVAARKLGTDKLAADLRDALDRSRQRLTRRRHG
jgi:hypothetical protein